MKRVGKDVSAAERWRHVGREYAERIAGPYHAHRLAVIKALLPDVHGRIVVDFGCGEGVLIRTLRDLGAADVIGVDIDERLLAMARGSGASRLIHGSVEQLRVIKSCDCIVAANVAAYFSDAEDRAFYGEVSRLLSPGGTLVITHSNELFDLFTLNAFTVDFFGRQFDVDARSLLTNPDEPARTTFNVRENPLAYEDKLAPYGLKIERMEFINMHVQPPLLTSTDYDDIDSREYPDTLEVQPRWKLMFQCSMFGVRAVRT